MITGNEISPIGFFGKPHGVNGEINFIIETDADIEDLTCIVLDIDGINVPFFFDSIRPRGAESYLVMIDGVDCEAKAAALTNKKVYALRSEIVTVDDEDCDDGFYAEDLVGYQITDTSSGLDGEITGVDDSTDNVLFIVRTSDGKQVLIPVADEFISGIDVDRQVVNVDLPSGLLDL